MSADTIDLSDSIPVESFPLEICRPGTKTPTGWTVHLAGPQHPNSIAVANEVGTVLIEEEFAMKAASASGQKYEPAIETMQMRRRKSVNRVCRRILGWSPNPTFKNVQAEPLEFSVAAATDLFLRPDMSVYFLQVVNYLNSERAFIQPSEVV
jgi:hypothetical protein